MVVNFFELLIQIVVILEIDQLADEHASVCQAVVFSDGELLLMGELIPHVFDFEQQIPEAVISQSEDA